MYVCMYALFLLLNSESSLFQRKANQDSGNSIPSVSPQHVHQVKMELREVRNKCGGLTRQIGELTRKQREFRKERQATLLVKHRSSSE